MKFTQTLAPLAALLSAAQAWNETTYYTTVITTDYTTYCPSPTTVTYGNVTYTERALWDAHGNLIERGKGDVVHRFKVPAAGEEASS